MTSAAKLLLLIILFVLLAILVIIVAALVQRPRAAWRAQWKLTSEDVRESRGRRMIGEPVQPALVRFDDIWATESEPGSAYIAAPRIPTREVVEERLSIGPYAVSEETLQRAVFDHRNGDLATPLVGVPAAWYAKAQGTPSHWAPRHPERHTAGEPIKADAAVAMIADSAYSTEDASTAPAVPLTAPPLPPAAGATGPADVEIDHLDMTESEVVAALPDASDDVVFVPTEFSPATTQVAHWVRQGTEITVSWVTGLDIWSKISDLREPKAPTVQAGTEAETETEAEGVEEVRVGPKAEAGSEDELEAEVWAEAETQAFTDLVADDDLGWDGVDTGSAAVELDVIGSDVVGSDAAASGVVELDVADSDVVELGVAEPDAADFFVVDSGVADPDAVGPDVAELYDADPDVADLYVAEQGVAESGVEDPELVASAPDGFDADGSGAADADADVIGADFTRTAPAGVGAAHAGPTSSRASQWWQGIAAKVVDVKESLARKVTRADVFEPETVAEVTSVAEVTRVPEPAEVAEAVEVAEVAEAEVETDVGVEGLELGDPHSVAAVGGDTRLDARDSGEEVAVTFHEQAAVAEDVSGFDLVHEADQVAEEADQVTEAEESTAPLFINVPEVLARHNARSDHSVLQLDDDLAEGAGEIGVKTTTESAAVELDAEPGVDVAKEPAPEASVDADVDADVDDAVAAITQAMADAEALVASVTDRIVDAGPDAQVEPGSDTDIAFGVDADSVRGFGLVADAEFAEVGPGADAEVEPGAEFTEVEPDADAEVESAAELTEATEMQVQAQAVETQAEGAAATSLQVEPAELDVVQVEPAELDVAQVEPAQEEPPPADPGSAQPVGVVPLEDVPSEDEPPHPIFRPGTGSSELSDEHPQRATVQWLEALMSGGPVLPRDDYRASLPPLNRDKTDS